MKKISLSYVLLLGLFFHSCYNQEPGYKYSLFDSTPSEELARAVEYEDVDNINKLIKERKVNIEFKEPKYNQTLLMLAVSTQKTESVRTLLSLGANPNTRASSGATPLMDACHYAQYKPKGCETEIIKLLVQYGADVNAIMDSSSYISPLTNAVMCENQFRTLVELGADVYFAHKEYLVWSSLLLSFDNDQLYNLKYLIIEKKYKVPKVISSRDDGLKYDVWHYLNKQNIPFFLFWKISLRRELISYLKDHPEQFCEDCSTEIK